MPAVSFCSLAMTVGLVYAAGANCVSAQTLTKLWTSARTGGLYKEPDRGELRDALRLFERTFAGVDDWASLQNEWKRLRFELLTSTEEGMELHIVHEQSEHREGRGLYVIRGGPAPALTLQAPHGVDDLHTAKIALLLFREGKLQGCAWNTVPRESGDLAHLEASFLQAFTQAAAIHQPRGLVVQIHGFETMRRKTSAARDTEIVLSNGSTRTTPGLLEVARNWARDLTPRVKVYPHQINELGGTTNTQGDLLRSLGHEGFVHVEFSLALRLRLRDDAEARKKLLQGLLGTDQTSAP